MMHRAHVALTPGRDFGPHAAERYRAPVLRQLDGRSCEEAVQRLPHVPVSRLRIEALRAEW